MINSSFLLGFTAQNQIQVEVFYSSFQGHLKKENSFCIFMSLINLI